MSILDYIHDEELTQVMSIVAMLQSKMHGVDGADAVLDIALFHAMKPLDLARYVTELPAAPVVIDLIKIRGAVDRQTKTIEDYQPLFPLPELAEETTR